MCTFEGSIKMSDLWGLNYFRKNTMQNCWLHPLLFRHLDISNELWLCRKHILVSYCNESQESNVYSGIRQAAIYRLKYPQQNLFFLSFLPIDMLRQKDNYGILSLPGTLFVRLPCAGERFHDLINNFECDSWTISHDQWNSFCEHACSQLLKEQMAEIMHGKKHEIGNRALHPLRAAATILLSNPDNISFKEAFASRLTAYNEYMEKPYMSEMIELTLICQNAADPFVLQTIALTGQFKKIAEYNYYPNEIKKLISDIDLTNKALHAFH